MYQYHLGYILDVTSNQVVISVHQQLIATKNVLYRVDKDETLDSTSTPLSNLAKLFQVGSGRDEKIRQLVIHKKKPEFGVEKMSIRSANSR